MPAIPRWTWLAGRPPWPCADSGSVAPAAGGGLGGWGPRRWPSAPGSAASSHPCFRQASGVSMLDDRHARRQPPRRSNLLWNPRSIAFRWAAYLLGDATPRVGRPRPARRPRRAARRRGSAWAPTPCSMTRTFRTQRTEGRRVAVARSGGGPASSHGFDPCADLGVSRRFFDRPVSTCCVATTGPAAGPGGPDRRHWAND